MNPLLRALALGSLFLALNAQAEIPAEIRVYDDGIGEAGEWGFEIHSSRTLRRSRVREANGELPTDLGLRVTPEISYAFGPRTELSILFPSVIDRHGDTHLGGQQLQLKWIFAPAPESGGVFAGINGELVTATGRFDERRNSVEIRPIVGYRDEDWLLIANLLASYGLPRKLHRGGFDLSPAFKVARSVAPGVRLGIETYSELGKLAHPSPRPQQEHTAYLTLDIAHRGWTVNLGVGRGLNTATDPWILKTIVEFPID
jgi:hypothetical protein